MADAPIECEVAYARPERQFVYRVVLPSHATVRDALMRAFDAGLRDQCPEFDERTTATGVFGKVVPMDYRLKSGDRVEIYRPLSADPRTARRARVKAQR